MVQTQRQVKYHSKSHGSGNFSLSKRCRGKMMARSEINLPRISSTLTAPLLVVIPIYNEESNIADVIARWSETLRALGLSFQIVALDDGSRDRTHEILIEMENANPGLLCVIRKPNSGHGRTCRLGYDVAVNSSAEWILQIDSDGQCDPVFFPEFWQRRTEADCIFGVRVVRDDGWIRKLISTSCRLLTTVFTGKDLQDVNVPYRLMKRTALQSALKSVPPDFDLQNIALTLALKRRRDLRWLHLPIRFRARQGGRNSIDVGDILGKGWALLRQIHRVGEPS